MGISINSDRLPFAMLLGGEYGEDAFLDLVKDLKDQWFERNGPAGEQDNLGHGWMMHHQIGKDFGDIFTDSEFTKDNSKVWFVELCPEGDEYCLVAENKSDLKQFMQDFQLNGVLEKNLKVIQYN